MQINTQTGQPRIKALLGPTNTGKTHFALERMLGHETGMIGFPLRLLARENYDRAVKIKGAGRVALITGEEKIVPDGARYFFCTVESMPMDKPVHFLAVDEIQLAADPDRGHVFTSRLLHARGTEETMFMGADTIRVLLGALVPDAEFISRPRLSTLTYTGAKKITRLPPRTAVVAFSAADVYRLAEALRRHAGGAAVVMGALSPRTRNAQVDMYQAGEVDYLVATDAIGMGLNMDVDHVALAGTRKFDGRMARNLTAPELAQIAGRAGRHMNDGTFGTTQDAPELDEDTVRTIETHAFDSLKTLQWRNPALDFSNVDTLLRSLSEAPPLAALSRTREADDELILKTLLKDNDVRARAGTPGRLRLIWDVAQVPDFTGVMSDAHADLLRHIFLHLSGRDGVLPTDWVAEQVAQVDNAQGAIEALMTRLAAIRTWTYVAFQTGWIADAAHWQDQTRAAEDRLSDALHDQLVRRFVDKRSAHLGRGLRDGADMTAAVSNDGQVTVEGHDVGRLDGFRFAADVDGAGTDAGTRRTVTGAAMKALRGEVTARTERITGAKDDAFTLDGRAILWEGATVAHLSAGADALSPKVQVLDSELLDAATKTAIGARLETWTKDRIAKTFEPMVLALKAELSGPARGIVFQLAEGLGSIRRRGALDQIKALGRADRKALRELGVRIGREAVYFPTLLKAGPVRLRGILYATFHDRAFMPLPEGRVRIDLNPGTERDFYEASGFRPLGTFALRIDMLERIASRAFALTKEGDGVIWKTEELMSLAGAGADALEEIMKHIGYRKTNRTPPVVNAPEPTPEAAAQPESETKTETRDEAETVVVYVRGRPAPDRKKPNPRQRKKAADKTKAKPEQKPNRKRGDKQKPTSKAAPRSHPRAKPREPDPDSPFYKLKDLIKS